MLQMVSGDFLQAVVQILFAWLSHNAIVEFVFTLFPRCHYFSIAFPSRLHQECYLFFQVPSHRSLMVESGVLDVIFREIRHRFHSLRIKREIGMLLGNLALEESAHDGMVEQGKVLVEVSCMKGHTTMRSNLL